MGFETLGGDRPLVVRPIHETRHLSITLLNDSGGELKEGQEVILKSTGLLDKRDAGTELPIGIVEKGGANGEYVTVGLFLLSTVSALASGNLSAGALVKPSGVVTNGRPVYAAVADGDYCAAVVLKGANDGLAILVGIFRSPFRGTAPAV